MRLVLAAALAGAVIPLAAPAHAAPCTKPHEPVCQVLIAACDALPPTAIGTRICL